MRVHDRHKRRKLMRCKIQMAGSLPREWAGVGLGAAGWEGAVHSRELHDAPAQSETGPSSATPPSFSRLAPRLRTTRAEACVAYHQAPALPIQHLSGLSWAGRRHFDTLCCFTPPTLDNLSSTRRTFTVTTYLSVAPLTFWISVCPTHHPLSILLPISPTRLSLATTPGFTA